ncbi:DMT family transporter [Falsigemmobacter faecalis]|uniref:DMT family transporter n=1 Tax=Falsigemmobacter faecalis TaxID=2488730 RepID=UPI001F378205|nr:DMT family transporter [Falsigemmobacter faecalis]
MRCPTSEPGSSLSFFVWQVLFFMLLQASMDADSGQWGVSPMGTATGQVMASSLIMLPLVMMLDRPWTLPPPSLTAIGALIGVAAISTALAYVLYFRILATAGATNLLLVTFLIPISAILLGTFFLGESLLPRHFAGIALIGAGLAAIDGRLWRTVRTAIDHRKGTTSEQ